MELEHLGLVALHRALGRLELALRLGEGRGVAGLVRLGLGLGLGSGLGLGFANPNPNPNPNPDQARREGVPRGGARSVAVRAHGRSRSEGPCLQPPMWPPAALETRPLAGAHRGPRGRADTAWVPRG